jgi:probable F420-dependent oxidoreductase
MKVGITLPHLGSAATRENIIHMAKIAEQERFDSLWVFERLLWPLKPQTPYPATPDGSLPAFYHTVFDPLETLTFVAANTNKIALGTSVIDMLFHNPVILARRFATLDVLSEGRAIAGLGIGWSKDEYQASNIPYENRGKRVDEFIQALKKMWRDDVVEFKGEYYNIPASKIGPKPIQKPHIPIYLGGYVTKTLNRIANYADGWLADVSGPLEYIEDSIKALRDLGSKANRNPNEIKVLAFPFPQIAANTDNRESENKRSGRSNDSQFKRLPLVFKAVLIRKRWDVGQI